ncbi:NADAR family protein [Sphaerisporangium rhizosphaerae]|uniref:NADAR family protein n=1 Tax=Sphaerisporangium rhizosphaerae TaxID=2269375 RepID=A0ABW2P9Y9_9ACTN
MAEAVDVRDVAGLVEVAKRGERIKYLMFWGHRPPRSGGAGAGCLSQWWPAEFVVDGVVYRTAEHFMMAEKARLFGDEDSVAAIVAAGHPKQAKDLGRSVRGFDEGRWAAARFDLVVRGNLAKFEQHADLREFLLGTGERVLVEASPVDRVWGIGLAADDEEAENPESWHGLNLLGFALMEVRQVLRRSPPVMA